MPPHHFRVTPLVVLQIDKVAVSEFFCPIGKLPGKNMRVTVDFEHRRKSTLRLTEWSIHWQLTKNSAACACQTFSTITAMRLRCVAKPGFHRPSIPISGTPP